MKLGEKLRKVRLDNSCTQTQLAQKMHITQGYISSVENNLYTPSAMYVALFCYVFGISKAELFEEVE